ncbi:MAG: hypothetical protein US52_C0045G0011 [candidate division WS6 bacterium GW2011_GWA2_37_6]|uniref:Uncharacterized protein n=1 Tax=candidate division WS6 bacterium GW2011_GWA2_37_6 TaxID=1619087 RepID=A0A0G0K2G9_9BACT|nr:MAG: hypothetical protein US52_C0045G0011 [candidate division WS6 bacterium GW2011_GWA2_37_6]
MDQIKKNKGMEILKKDQSSNYFTYQPDINGKESEEQQPDQSGNDLRGESNTDNQESD